MSTPVSEARPFEDPHAPFHSGELPRALRIFLFAILGFTIVSLAYNLIARSLGFGLPYSFAYFFVPDAFFSDFREFGDRFFFFSRPEFFTQKGYFMYPPAMVLPIEACYATAQPGKAFFLFVLGAGLFFAAALYRILRRNGLAVWPSALLTCGIGLTSYPYLLLLLRWNIEVFVWVAVTFGLWNFYRGRYAWAAVCIGLATAFKLYPFLLFSLFLSRRRYRDIALGVFTTFAVTVIALRALSPHVGYAFAWNAVQLKAFGSYYVAAPFSLGYDHSFFALVKFVTLPWLPDLTPLVRPYMWLVAISCLVFYFARIRKLPLANQIIILSVLSVGIAPVSYDYTLLSLYASLAVLCVVALKTPENKQSTLTPFFLLYAIILTPQSYVILRGAHFYGELRALCLLAILVLAARKPLPAESSEQHHGESTPPASPS
jgi:hypothetical protein